MKKNIDQIEQDVKEKREEVKEKVLAAVPAMTWGHHMRSVLLCILSAVLVSLSRNGYIVGIQQIGGIDFHISDIFVVTAAGLCGYQYGVFIFLLIFFVESFVNRGNTLALFPLFLYLMTALQSGWFSEKKWYKSIKRTVIACLIMLLSLSVAYYWVFGCIFMLQDITFPKSFIGMLPEMAFSSAFLYLFFRYAPDKIRNNIGIGFVYSELYDPFSEVSKGKEYKRIRRRISVVSLVEGLILSGAATFLSSARMRAVGQPGSGREIGEEIQQQTDFLRIGDGTHEISTFILALTICVTVSIIANEIIMQMVSSMEKKSAKLESELSVAEAKSEAKSTFLSSMSHEIRTPINAVIGMNEMILRESSEESTIEYAENIRNASTTLLGLVNDILDFSKIEAGKMDIINSDYQLSSVLNDLVNMIQVRAEKKGLELIIDVDPQMPDLLNGDEVRIKQVTTNILTNAVKYTEKGSVTLKIGYEDIDSENIMMSVSVKDTGIGIKEEDIGKLFKAFERIEEERNKTIEGTGLGMNITMRLLDMMGSKMEVASVYGEGSDFSFKIKQKVVKREPIGDFREALRKSRQVREHYTESFRAPDARVLCVDDTKMNLSVFCGLLKKTKVKIDTVESGFECLNKVRDIKYDMIFLDHRMPKMDGVETLRKMKEMSDNLNTDVPVIALTANAASGARDEYISLGFTDYLSKPIEAKKLEKMMIKYLPEEKLLPAENAAEEKSSDNPEVTEELPTVEGLDWNFAKLHLPDTDLLKTTVSDFYAVIDLNADKLNKYYERLPDDETAWDDYRILVHGMKSSAATVGIIPSSGMARVLERAAGNKDIVTIMSLHEMFINEWRSNKERLKGVFGLGENEETAAGEEFDADIIRGVVETIKAAMEDFDTDKADSAVEMLRQYSVPEDIKPIIDELAGAVADVDPDSAGEAADKILSALN